MNKEKRKINLIINELVSFLFKYKASEIHISIKESENNTKITVFGNIDVDKEKILEELNERLKTPRIPEIEDLYWELVGDIGHGDELYLLGTMVDNSDVSYSNNLKGIIITIDRKK
jgi:hypothetical protein